MHVIREDPANRDLLFVGTSRAVYVSLDRGQTWTTFTSGMPNVPVYDLQIHPRDHELIAATHGRGFWIVDIAPLQQMAGAAGSRVMAGNAYLFAPRVAYDYGEPPNMGESANGIGHKTFQTSRARRTAPRSRIASARCGRTDGAVAGVDGGVAVDRRRRSSSPTPAVTRSRVLNGPGGPGLHKVVWNSAAAQRRARALRAVAVA